MIDPGPAYLVVDLDRVLVESEHGKAARSSIEAILKRAEQQRLELVERCQRANDPASQRAANAELEAHRRRVGQELGKRQGSLRKALVQLATKVARTVADERGIGLVLDRRQVLVFEPGADMTDEVIARVDDTRLSRPKPRS